MSLFKNATYNYTEDTIEIAKNIKKYNDNNISKPNLPNIIVPSFIVSLSQSIISFILRKSSILPFFGTKTGEIREFEIDEFHILIVILLSFSIHYTRKYRNKCNKYKQRLEQLLVDSKIHNFETIAAIDDNNIKRIECLYYKNQFAFYDIDLLTRGELRSFIQLLMSQCDVLSDLSLKILEAINLMFKQQRKYQLQLLYKNKLNKNNNNNLRSNSMQQRLKIELRNKEIKIDSDYERSEEKLDKFQSFFDEKNNEQYLTENREEHRKNTEKEILNEYKNQNEQKQIEINAVKLSKDNDDQKMTEEEDEENQYNPLQKRQQLLRLEMNYDHEYLRKHADNLPIQQIDFSEQKISPYNLQKQVNQIKYDIILNQKNEKRRELTRKYGIITVIVATSVFTYWYNRHYEGKGITQRIRDTKATFFSYF